MTKGATAATSVPRLRRAVHPFFTHVPLGGLVIAAVFDVLSMAEGGARPVARELYRSASFVLVVATIVMMMAVVTGLVDRSSGTVAGTAARAKVNRHGVIMASVFVTSAVGNVLRGQVYPNAAATPALVLGLTLVALAAAVLGGELGARLTYRAGINVAQPAARVHG